MDYNLRIELSAGELYREPDAENGEDRDGADDSRAANLRYGVREAVP